MPADAAKLPPFRKLPFKAPDMEVRRGEGGVAEAEVVDGQVQAAASPPNKIGQQVGDPLGLAGLALLEKGEIDGGHRTKALGLRRK